MTIRRALGQIASLPYIGNRAGSIRSIKEFETEVANILRNVGKVVERPNGSNKRPAMILNGINFMIKTAKGKKPMWNESYIEPSDVLILNLECGTIVVHGSLITSNNLLRKLINAKNSAARLLKEQYPKDENDSFFVTGGRVQFGDNIDWCGTRQEFLNKTIEILEENQDES
jgi:hypothetical protein